MTYSFEIIHEDKSIIVVTKGDLETKEVAEMGLRILLKAKELKYKILFDYRLSKNKISIIEAYYWFSTHYNNIDNELQRIPTAYFVTKVDLIFYSFFETTCNNNGIPIKVFLDEISVLKWLKSY